MAPIRHLTGARLAFQNAPLCDFSQEANRQAMQAALAEVKKRLGKNHPPVIAGQSLTTTEFIESLNPSHKREIVGRCGKSTSQQAEQAIAAAKSAFPLWRATSSADRAQYLTRAAEVMRRRRFELAAWQVFECAKSSREADADVAESIDYCEFYAQEMLRLGSPRNVNLPGEENAYFYEPRGVVVVIAPWNFPLAILCGMTTAALVTGNTVVMKPAEQSAVIGAQLMDIFREIGLPSGVVNYLPGVGEEIGPVLVATSRYGPHRLHRFAGRGPAAQSPGRPASRRTGSHQTTHRRTGRQERHHRRRRRRPRRSRSGRDGQRVRLSRSKVLGLFPGHRSGADLSGVSRTAGRSDAQPEDGPGRGSRQQRSAPSSTPKPSSASSAPSKPARRTRGSSTPAIPASL